MVVRLYDWTFFAILLVALMIFVAGIYCGQAFWPNGLARPWQAAMEFDTCYRVWSKMPEYSGCYEAIIQEVDGNGPCLTVILPKEDAPQIQPGGILEKKIKDNGDFYLVYIRPNAVGNYVDDKG